MVTRDTSLTRSGPVPGPALFGLLVLMLVCCTRGVLSDGDTFTHLAAGLWMVEHRSVLTFDPLSATFGGAPWVAHEWLSEVLLALAYRAAGLSGVVLLAAVATAIAFANLARHIGQRCGSTATMLMTAAGLVCIMPSILARPHLLAMPVLELWVAALLRSREQRRPPPWAMLPLMTVWANLHGSFAFGIALTGVFAVASSFALEWRGWAALRWWPFLGATIGAALLTPRGVDGLLFPFQLLQLRSLAFVNEWQPVEFATTFNLGVLLAGFVALIWTGRVRVGLFRSLLLVALVYLALAHSRHSLLIGIAGPLLLAKPVGDAFTAGAGRRPLAGRRAMYWCVVACVLVMRLALPIGINNLRATPISALAQLPQAALDMPMLNSVQFGGYLAMLGLHPFVDGRVELFGDQFLDDYRTMAEAEPGRLQSQLNRYGIAWTLLAVEDPLVKRFETLDGWRREYADGIAVVFVRRRGG